MSEHSKIEWTDATWNPVTGCTKISPGCAHCYAERQTERFHGPGSFDKVVLHPERLEQPLHWRKPRRVFVNSMSDLFHDDVPSEFIAECLAVMGDAKQHTFQILTKRPARMKAVIEDIMCFSKCPPPENIWFGVSVENQHFADERIPLLLQTPAAVRFISAEPLLGPVDLSDVEHRYYLHEWVTPNGVRIPRGLDWVICGGESGPGARPMNPDWARSLRDQCIAEQVPFFFKQWGEWSAQGQPMTKGGFGTAIFNWNKPGTDIPVTSDCRCSFRVGKKAAGRLLDGIEWNEYPR